MKFHLALFLTVAKVIAASSFTVNSTKLSENSLESTRSFDKHFNLFDLIKLFSSAKSKSIDGRKKSKSKGELVPFDGLHLNDDIRRVEKATSLAELNRNEGLMDMTSMMKPERDVKKEEEPQFWVFDKFASKVDLLFMTKVLLKIIVFKKIVKFIALVCLLFFLPTINDNSEDEKKDSRNLNVYGKRKKLKFNLFWCQISTFFADQIDYRTKEILYFAITALEGFSLDRMVWCVADHDAFCRFQVMFDNVDQIYTIDK